MGFEDEIDDWVEDRESKDNDAIYLKFHDKNQVDCKNVSMLRIMFEYTCWVLGGKPKDFKYYTDNK